MNRMQFVTTLAVMGVMSLAGSFIAATIMQATPAGAQADGDKVITSEFQLKDKNGKLRALMKVDDGGDLLFTLLDANEKVRITQSVGNDGSGAVIVSDSKGRPRMSLTSSESDPGAFSVFDSNGEPAALLAVGKGDFPMMTLKAPTGQAILGIQSDGSGLLTLSEISGEGDEKDSNSYFSVVGGKGVPSVMLLENARGKGEIQLVASDDGSNILSLRENKEMRCFLSSGAGDTTAFQLDNGSGSKVYIQAQKSGTALMQLNGGENYVRSMSNKDGTAEFAVIKKKQFAWKETGEKAK